MLTQCSIIHLGHLYSIVLITHKLSYLTSNEGALWAVFSRYHSIELYLTCKWRLVVCCLLKMTPNLSYSTLNEGFFLAILWRKNTMEAFLWAVSWRWNPTRLYSTPNNIFLQTVSWRWHKNWAVYSNSKWRLFCEASSEVNNLTELYSIVNEDFFWAVFWRWHPILAVLNSKWQLLRAVFWACFFFFFFLVVVFCEPGLWAIFWR